MAPYPLRLPNFFVVLLLLTVMGVETLPILVRERTS